MKYPKALPAIAQETRYQIVRLLHKHGKMMVSALKKRTSTESTLLSHHLSALKSADIIQSKRMGKQVQYRLCPGVKSGKGIKANGFKLILEG